MAEKQYLIFDFGASNGRATVASFDGSRVKMDVTYRFDNRPVIAAGTLYWDTLRLFSELKLGLQASLKKYPDVVSMAIDTWGCDFGFIDRNGKLLGNPVTYRDKPRHDRSPLLYETLPRRELFQLSAGSTLEIMGLYQLFSFKCDSAPELREGHRMLMIPDLLNYLLTGRPCNEYSDATMSLACDQNARTWEKRVLNRLGIPDTILGELVMPGDMIGPIQRQVCDELAVRALPVVAPATHDTASAVIGIPVSDGSKNWAFISMGTWSIAGVETSRPIVTDAAFESGFGNNAISDGRNMLVNYITGLWIIQQCREKWVADAGADISWDEIVGRSDAAGPATAFIDVDDAAFSLPNADMPGVVVDWCEKKGQRLERSIGAVARCVYESLVLKYRVNLETLERITGKPLDFVHLVGGGVQNRTLCQWTADAMGVPVIAGPTETTSMGNLLMQLRCSGDISSLEQGRAVSLRSSEVSRYEPRSRAPWDDAAGKYRNMSLR
jgi:sugar (pentulose or hexulose) kinase